MSFITRLKLVNSAQELTTLLNEFATYKYASTNTRNKVKSLVKIKQDELAFGVKK